MLSISGQCLFSNNGLNWDTLETELKEEGWLLEQEDLWNVLQDEQRLKRCLECQEEESPFDDTWTDEDYEYFYNNL